jgi:hypothetical protein
MGLTDVTGVFSRYFVVGFFLPAYVALVSLWLSASSDFLPDQLEEYSQAGQLAILGGVALIAGLVLSGLNYYIIQWFEGYPLERTERWPVLGLAYKAAIAGQSQQFDRLTKIWHDENRNPAERQDAAWCLDRFYPEARELLLPTRVGNAIRAFERHSNIRWGLDSVTLWPRIEGLLSSSERDVLMESKTNFNVFINASFGAVLVGALLIVDGVLHAPQRPLYWLLYAIPFVFAYLLYRAAIGPTTDWGDSVRSGFDLHRLEIYEKLGVRAPRSFSDERDIATRVNQALLYGRPLLNDDLWRAEKLNENEQATEVGSDTPAQRSKTGG